MNFSIQLTYNDGRTTTVHEPDQLCSLLSNMVECPKIIVFRGNFLDYLSVQEFVKCKGRPVTLRYQPDIILSLSDEVLSDVIRRSDLLGLTKFRMVSKRFANLVKEDCIDRSNIDMPTFTQSFLELPRVVPSMKVNLLRSVVGMCPNLSSIHLDPTDYDVSRDEYLMELIPASCRIERPSVRKLRRTSCC
ncbi:hypothetical protein P9112_014083 [Eukaryota sp. TZLM1-RC]